MQISKKIDHHIECLLFKHNYVIVPGFGGFVAKEIPAKIGKSGYTIIPPSKSLVFNQNLTANDGLLMQELVLKQQLDFDTAEKIVETQVNCWKLQIKSGEPIVIEGVGMFRKNIDNAIVFKHFAQSNFYIPSYGLEIAKIRAVQKPAYATKKSQFEGNDTVETKTIVIEKLPVSYQRFKTLSIASIAVLAISATYLYMLSFNPQLIEKAGLNIFDIPIIDDADLKRLEEAKKNGEYLSEVIELHKNDDSSLKDQNTEPTERKSNTEALVDEEHPSLPETPANGSLLENAEPLAKEIGTEKSNNTETNPTTLNITEYHVIVSVISSSAKIDEEVKKFTLKGYEPIILPTNTGTFRISIGKFNTKDSADIFKQNILNDNNINSWILPK